MSSARHTQQQRTQLETSLRLVNLTSSTETVNLTENDAQHSLRFFAVALRMHQTLAYYSLDNQCEY